MINLSDIFTFKVIFNESERIVNPLYDDLIWSHTPSGEVNYDWQLETSLLFIGSDYKYFRSIYDNEGLCGKVNLQVIESGVVRYECVITMTGGDWRRRDNNVTFRTTPILESEAFELILKDKVNIFDAEPLGPLAVFRGTVSEAITCTFTSDEIPSSPEPPSGCLPDGIGWTLTTVDEVEDENFTTGFQSYRIDAEWKREEYSGTTAPGAGWELISPGLWGRRLPVGAPVITSNTQYDPDIDEATTTRNVRYPIIGEADNPLPDNGVNLSSILELLLAETDITVRSDIFNINPDGSHPDNHAYSFKEFYAGIVIFQKTDIKNVDALENATIGEISLEQLFELFEMMEIFYTLKNDILRIEHISFFEGENGLDISGFDQIRLMDNFGFDEKEIPRQETFTWMDDEPDTDFAGLPIRYPIYCAQGDEKPRAAKRFSPNLERIIARPTDYVNEGFVPVATDIFQGQNYLITTDRIIGEGSVFNGPFSMAFIHNALYRNNRPLLMGNLNGEDIVFDTAIPQVKQEPLRVPVSYSLYFTNFNPSKRAKSQMGWGKIGKAEFSAKNNLLTLDLKHDD